jgi:hypothetical protein
MKFIIIYSKDGVLMGDWFKRNNKCIELVNVHPVILNYFQSYTRIVLQMQGRNVYSVTFLKERLLKLIDHLVGSRVSRSAKEISSIFRPTILKVPGVIG